MKFREIKCDGIERFFKQLFDTRKGGLTARPLATDELFGLEPYILDGVLVWSVGGKLNACQRPIRSRTAKIDPFQVFPQLDTPMVRCTIPAENNLFAFVLLAQELDENERPFGIAGLNGNDRQRTRIGIDGAIIRLSLPLIEDRDRDPGIAWPPHVTTGIAPHEMTFIDVEHDH